MDGMNGHMDDDMEHMDYGDESGQMVSQLQQITSISNLCPPQSPLDQLTNQLVFYQQSVLGG